MVATRQEVIDRFWMEFMQFYTDIRKAAKQEELDNGLADLDMSKMFDLLGDSKKLQHLAVFEEFKEPSIVNFWKWYSMAKMEAKVK